MAGEATVEAVRHYLDRTGHLLRIAAAAPDADAVLARSVAPGMFDTGLNFAIAIQFAARALCPPGGRAVPEIPEPQPCESLLRYHGEITALIAPIRADDLCETVTHHAGKARLTQEPAPYIAEFALPNMIFHLTMAYAGLRQAGLPVGKADFDGMHLY